MKDISSLISHSYSSILNFTLSLKISSTSPPSKHKNSYSQMHSSPTSMASTPLSPLCDQTPSVQEHDPPLFDISGSSITSSSINQGQKGANSRTHFYQR